VGQSTKSLQWQVNAFIESYHLITSSFSIYLYIRRPFIIKGIYLSLYTSFDSEFWLTIDMWQEDIEREQEVYSDNIMITSMTDLSKTHIV
jgi:hypothetical protein